MEVSCVCEIIVFSDYEVVVVTGDKQNAGTDSNVYITIYGKTGATAKTILKSNKKKDPFQTGTSELIKIHSNCVGPLTKVRIEHDNTGFAPGWFLERVSRYDSILCEIHCFE